MREQSFFFVWVLLACLKSALPGYSFPSAALDISVASLIVFYIANKQRANQRPIAPLKDKKLEETIEDLKGKVNGIILRAGFGGS